MKRIALALALLLAAAVAAAQSTDRYRPTPPEPSVKRSATGSVNTSPRLNIGRVDKGERAPDFELSLAGGGKVKLSTLRGQWVVVCFCPRRSLDSVDSIARGVPERVPVLGVVPEKVGVLSAWTAQHKTQALLLDDATGDIAALYGIFDAARGTPRSGYVVVNPKGVVHRIEIGDRLDPEEAARAVQYAVTGL